MAGRTAGHLGGGAARRGHRGAPVPGGRPAWTRPRCSRPRTAAISCGSRPGVVVDLDEARAALAAAREQLAGGIPARAAAHAERAGALARLPFLPQHEGEWVDGVRESWSRSTPGRSSCRCARTRRRGDLHAAADAAERLVRAEPFSEAAHQLRIRVLGEAGDRAGAVRGVRALPGGARRRARGRAVGGDRRRCCAARSSGRRLRSGPTPTRAVCAAYSVLVVEDHDFQRRTAVQLLRGLGVGTIAEAADGEAALELIARTGPPDVIVCDLEMPGMDGVEFIRHVAERDLASAVIISSAMDPKVVHAVEALAEALWPAAARARSRSP